MSIRLSMVVRNESREALVTLDRSPPDLEEPTHDVTVAFLKPAAYRRQGVELEEFQKIMREFLQSSTSEVETPQLGCAQVEAAVVKKMAYITALFALADRVANLRLVDTPEPGETYERNLQL